MSAIKEFNQLNIAARTMAGIVLQLMPFWYLDLFLLSRIPDSANIQIPIVISFCLSACWYFMNVISAALFLHTFPLDKSALSGIVEFAIFFRSTAQSYFTLFGIYGTGIFITLSILF